MVQVRRHGQRNVAGRAPPHRRRYEEALRLRPGDVYLMIDLASVHELRGQLADPRAYVLADRLWRDIAARNPHDWQVRHAYGWMLAAWAQTVGGDELVLGRAAEQLALAAAARPDQGDVARDLEAVLAALDAACELGRA